MAQADSVPTANPAPITGAISKASTKHARRRRYEVITGGMPIGPYLLTAVCATSVILVACAPWNILFILGLLLSRDEVLRYGILNRCGSSS